MGADQDRAESEKDFRTRVCSKSMSIFTPLRVTPPAVAEENVVPVGALPVSTDGAEDDAAQQVSGTPAAAARPRINAGNNRLFDVARNHIQQERSRWS